ncbi:hypothetical protein BJ508DRAFT_97162 [Ascobolus immersus RN42]|uniref:SGNH hydrolase-type esterase domain-containing protein n=1 Tax=Ascobolus immersus RN42 TaxID=1160509 RepID=A0A3N4IMT8_ASCIM|nr:hypothetical protein BJ508DRAFT_97162 [Ascobolus immersus RN42]
MYVLPSTSHFYPNKHPATGTLPKRLIVFGNAWSNPSSRQPQVWSNILCNKLSLDCTNFSTGGNSTTINDKEVGVIDSLLFNSTSPDLRSQVSSFLAAEKARNAALNLPTDFQQNLKSRAMKSYAQQKGLFIFNFGLSEMWQMSGPDSDRKKAEASVKAAIDMLFEELEALAVIWPEVLQAIVMLPVDVSLLPAWKRERQPFDKDGHMQRMAFEMMRYWNKELEFRAAKWPRGEVLLWDVNQWFAEEVMRGEEVGWKKGWREMNPLEACLKGGEGEEEMQKCSTGSDGEWLMWDDVLISPRAQRKMADRLIEALW